MAFDDSYGPWLLKKNLRQAAPGSLRRSASARMGERPGHGGGTTKAPFLVNGGLTMKNGGFSWDLTLI